MGNDKKIDAQKQLELNTETLVKLDDQLEKLTKDVKDTAYLSSIILDFTDIGSAIRNVIAKRIANEPNLETVYQETINRYILKIFNDMLGSVNDYVDHYLRLQNEKDATNARTEHYLLSTRANYLAHKNKLEQELEQENPENE